MEMLRVEFADVIITVINLLVIAFLMKLFLFKPIMKVIDERNKMINDDFEKAKQSKEKAEKMLKDHEEQMASVEDEAANLLADAKKRAEGEYNRIVSEADTEAKDILIKQMKLQSRQLTKHFRVHKDALRSLLSMLPRSFLSKAAMPN